MKASIRGLVFYARTWVVIYVAKHSHTMDLPLGAGVESAYFPRGLCPEFTPTLLASFFSGAGHFIHAVFDQTCVLGTINQLKV